MATIADQKVVTEAEQLAIDSGTHGSYKKGFQLALESDYLMQHKHPEAESVAFQAQRAAEAQAAGRPVTEGDRYAENFRDYSLYQRRDAARAEVAKLGPDAEAAFKAGRFDAGDHLDRLDAAGGKPDRLMSEAIQNAHFMGAVEEAKRAGHYDSWLEGVKLGIAQGHLEVNRPEIGHTFAFQDELKAYKLAQTGSEALTSHEAFAESSADLSHTYRMQAAHAAAEKIGPDAVEAQLAGHSYGMDHAYRGADLGHADQLTAEAIQNLHFHGAAEEAKRAGHYDSWHEGVRLGIEQAHLEANRPDVLEAFAFQDDLKAYKLAQTGSETLTSHEAIAESSADLSHTYRMQAAKAAAEKIGPDAVEAQLNGHAFGMEHAERGAEFGHVDQLTAEAVQNLHFHGAAEEAKRAGHYDSWVEGAKLGVEGHRLENVHPASQEAVAFQERKTAANAAAHAVSDNAQTGLWHGYKFGMEHAERNAELGVAKESVKVLAEDGVKLLAKDAVKMVAGGPVGDALVAKDVAELASKAPSVTTLLSSDAGYNAVSALAATAVVGGVKHFADEHGITAKLDPVIDAARHHMEPATKALHSFQDGVQDFIHKGDAVIASAQHYAHEKLDPVIEPVQKVASEAASHVAKAAEPLTKPVEERMAAVGEVVSTAVGKGWDSAMNATERHEAQAVQQAYGSLLQATAHGSPGLTNDEARMVRAELPHVQKGDVFVVEPQGSMHLVPAGSPMPDFPKGSLHLDADALREAAGIERAPQQHAPQQLAQADAVRER